MKPETFAIRTAIFNLHEAMPNMSGLLTKGDLIKLVEQEYGCTIDPAIPQAIADQLTSLGLKTWEYGMAYGGSRHWDGNLINVAVEGLLLIRSKASIALVDAFNAAGE